MQFWGKLWGIHCVSSLLGTPEQSNAILCNSAAINATFYSTFSALSNKGNTSQYHSEADPERIYCKNNNLDKAVKVHFIS